MVGSEGCDSCFTNSMSSKLFDAYDVFEMYLGQNRGGKSNMHMIIDDNRIRIVTVSRLRAIKYRILVNANRYFQCT